jgi:hypothetical protein
VHTGSHANGQILSARFAPAGRVVVHRLGGIMVFGLDGGTVAQVASSGAPNDTAFSPDGHWLAYVTKEGQVRIVATDGGALLRTFSLHTPIRTLRVSPDGSKLYAGTDGGGWLLNTGPDSHGADQIHRVAVSNAHLFPLETRARIPGVPTGGWCPPGTTPVGAPYPQGRASWCIRSSGRADGPLRMWGANGIQILDERFDDGIPTGTWRHWDAAGRLAEELEHTIVPGSTFPNVVTHTYGVDGLQTDLDVRTAP